MVGSGRVGASLALAAADAGLFEGLAVVGRSASPPATLRGRSRVRYLEADEAAGALSRTGRLPHLAFCVPDDRLRDAVRDWAERLSGASGEPGPTDGGVPVALHTSGVHPADVLEPLRAAGYACAGWHPLVAIPRARADVFGAVSVGIEGDAEAVAFGARLATALEARPLRVDSGEKARYHAAAVFASNHVAACLGVAVRELRRSGAAGAGLVDLLPLARSALEALEAAGIPEGLTGPVVRGDVGTLRRHLDALDPATGALYRALAAELVRLLGPRLDAGTGARLERWLASGGRGAEDGDGVRDGR